MKWIFSILILLFNRIFHMCMLYVICAHKSKYDLGRVLFVAYTLLHLLIQNWIPNECGLYILFRQSCILASVSDDRMQYSLTTADLHTHTHTIELFTKRGMLFMLRPGYTCAAAFTQISVSKPYIERKANVKNRLTPHMSTRTAHTH